MGWLPLRSPSLRIHNRKRSRYFVTRLIHPEILMISRLSSLLRFGLRPNHRTKYLLLFLWFCKPGFTLSPQLLKTYGMSIRILLPNNCFFATSLPLSQQNTLCLISCDLSTIQYPCRLIHFPSIVFPNTDQTSDSFFQIRRRTGRNLQTLRLSVTCQNSSETIFLFDCLQGGGPIMLK